MGAGLAAIAWSTFLTGTIGKPSRDVVVFGFGICGFFLVLTVSIHFGVGSVADILSGLAFVAPGISEPSQAGSRRPGMARPPPSRTRLVAPCAPVEPHADTVEADEGSSPLAGAERPRS